MHNPKTKFLTVIFVILLCTGFLPSAKAETRSDNDVLVLSSDETSFSFEVQIPWQNLNFENVVDENGVFTRVSMPEWELISEPGAPALPYLTKIIGVPFEAEITLEVTTGNNHIVKLPSAIKPVVIQEVDWSKPPTSKGSIAIPNVTEVVKPNYQFYGNSSVYPGSLAEVISDGVLREQRVASIAVYPVQFAPADNSLIIYETMQITVHFGNFGSDPNSLVVPDAQTYESIFEQMLENYEQAKSWRRSSAEISNQFQDASNSFEEGLDLVNDWTPPSQAWRVSISQEGFYQLTYEELDTAGLPVSSLDPRKFSLYNMGSAVAIEVVGESNGQFEPGESIIFYGQAIKNKYSEQNAYWLVVGDSNGLRMSTRDGNPSGAEIPLAYTATKQFEENQVYVTLTPGDDAFERFLWTSIFATSPKSWTHTFSLLAPSSGSGKLTLNLLGYLSNNINPDHHVQVKINNVLLGESWWDGVSWNNLELPIAAGLLTAGSNTLTVTCPNDTGVGYDLIFIDSMTLEYPNSFTAENNRLPFSYRAAGTWQFQVNGFMTDQLVVYDVSNPFSPTKITKSEVIPVGSQFVVKFQDIVSNESNFYATASSAFLNVDDIEQDTPSNLHSLTNGADYIVIAHNSFMTLAQMLATHRENQGYRTMVVDVQDIYDEFGYGIVGAVPIHDFLAYTYYNWTSPAPAFVVLMGDGHYDPKGYTGTTNVSYIPPYLAMADPSIGETAADNRYVTVAGTDKMPDMMLGRIPVNSISEANIIVNKIISYEDSPVSGDWNKNVLMVADNADSAGDFAYFSNDLWTRYQLDTFTVEKVHLRVTHNMENARLAIQTGIINGKVIVNYIGHAGYTEWADAEPAPDPQNPRSLLETEDVPLLINGGKLPVVLAMTCYEGFFHSPNFISLAEAIIRKEGGGAISSWSPSGAGVALGHDYLNRGFFKAFFHNGALTVGAATIVGKTTLWASGFNFDLLDTYLLFGDPALVFSRPLTAVFDYYTANQDTQLLVPTENGVLVNDINPGDNPITADLINSPLHGNLIFNTDGSFSYSPNLGWYGRDTFTYKANNGVEYSNTATTTITVFKTNHPPTDISLSSSDIYENMPINTVVGQFSTTDPDVGDTFNYTLVDGEGSIDNHLFNIYQNKLRSSSYYNFEEQSQRTIRVRTTDQRGAYYDEIFIINILDLNDAPVAINDYFEVQQNTDLVLDGFALTANDTDEDNSVNELYVLSVLNPIEGTATLQGTTITFTPTAGYLGLAGFSYYVSDGQLADVGYVMVNVTLETGNQPPVVSDIPDQTIQEGESFVSITLDDYVSDLDNPDAQLVWSFTGDGELVVSIVDRVATITIPDIDWNGSETITFRAMDPGGLWDEDTATFTVTAVNDAPVVTDIPDQTIAEGESFTTIALDDFVSDVDNTDAELVWSFTGNTELTVSITDWIATITSPNGWTGSETITFHATDPGGLWDEDAAVFTVTPIIPTYHIFLPLIIS